MNNKLPQIFVVDDDADLRTLLQNYLSQRGFEVSLFAEPKSMLLRLPRLRPDLIVLDQVMPGTDGTTVCRNLRAVGDDIPIILLTSCGDDIGRIIGLESGADDYVTKPANLRELVARIKAVLRRRNPAIPGAPVATEDDTEFGDWRLDLKTRTLSRGADRTPLSTGEFALLCALARHPYQILSRDRLLELASGRDVESFDRSVDVQIWRLRRIVGTDPQAPAYIQTVWGKGYVFVPDGRPPDGRPQECRPE